MTLIVPKPMSRQVLLIKAQKFAGQAGYFLQGGRWHAIKHDKPAPKGSPQAKHPGSAGQHAPVILTDEQIEQLKYPADKAATNKEMAAHNNVHLPKLLEHAAKGDATAILGTGFGTNSHSKKKALAANVLLGMMGSPHKVELGQAAGSHHAVQQAPSDGKPTERPAQAADVMGVFASLKGDIDAAAEKGDTEVLNDIKSYLSGPQNKSDTGAQAALAYLESKAGAATDKPKLGPVGQALKEAVSKPEPAAPAGSLPAMPAFVEGKTTNSVVSYYEGQAQKILDMAAAGDAAGLVAMKEAGLKPNAKGKVSNTFAGKTQNSKMLLALHAQAVEHAKGNTTADQPAAGVSAETVPAPAAPAAEASRSGGAPKAPDTGDNWSITKQDIADHIQAGDIESLIEEKNAFAGSTAPFAAEMASYIDSAIAHVQADKQTSIVEPTAATSKLSQIPWDSQLLPDSNKNAKSHNKQVAKIKAMAEAGDLAGLEALKFGVNTYGKKQEKLKQLAITALKEDAAAPAAAQAEPVKTATARSIVDKIGQAGSVSAAQEAATNYVVSKGKTAEAYDEVISALKEHGYNGSANVFGMLKDELHGSAEQGPQEGDTKQGADGMLVFKDGRWHKQEQPKAVEPAPVAEPEPAPVGKKLKASEAIALGKGLKTATGMKAKLKKLAVAGDVAGLQEFVAVANGMPASKKYAEKLIAAMTDGAPTAAQPKAAPVIAANGIESMDGWTQTGPQGGSNPGGKFKDQSGVEWYCKFPSDPDVAKSEILAAKLYAAAGVTGQDAKLITKDGKIGIASKWTTVSKASASQLTQTEGVLSGFATDAWLGNWDVVGLGYDNLQVGADGKAVRVDAGGSLTYRAQGGKKAFGNVVSEIDSLRDAKINPQAAAVFGKMSEADITASVAKVLAISDNMIRAMVEVHGPGDAANKKALADTLIARKADLAAKYPKAVKAKPPKPAFKVENLTAPPSFTNWNGSGKGLSSHQFINESNQAAVDAVYDAAKQGDLNAIKEVQAPIFDKGSGEVKNHVPLASHPSQHVKAYWSDMVNEVDLQLNPPRMPEIGEIVASQDLSEISALLKPVPAGASINMVSKHQKAGNYILLGKALDIAPAVPDDNDTVISSEAWKNKAIAHYHAATSEQKSSFSLYVTTSGARSLNTALRKGDLKAVVSGKSVATHVENFKGLLVDIPEGSTFVRRMGMKGYGQAPNEKAIKELQQFLMVAEPGTVMQEPGFTSTSWTGGNKILGNNDIEWEFVAGKGVKMFPAWLTANKGEGEGLLPPNQRYMIVSSKKDGKTVRVKAILLPTID